MNEVRFIPGNAKRWREMALGRVNSREPSAPWMRPNPESPTPPNGSAGTPAKEMTELTAVIPDRIARASSIARRASRAKTVPASP